MFSMKLEYFVTYLKDTFLGRHEDWEPQHRLEGNVSYITKKGLLIRLDLSMRNYDTHDTKRAVAYILLAGNCNVFAALAPFNSHFKDVKLSEFKNISNHDSCWRTEIGNWLTQIYFNWAREIGGDAAPRDLDSDCHPLFFKHAPVRLTYRREDNNPYRNVLTGVAVDSKETI